MSTFDREWNKIGLFYIPSPTGFRSYFLKRSWGNYLFFPHPDIESMFPFFIGSGGIYKVFDFTLPFPQMNKNLFNKFGAPTIGPSQEFHPDFQIEKYGVNYQDVDLKLGAHSAIYSFIKGDTFTFLDNEELTELNSPYTLKRIYN